MKDSANGIAPYVEDKEEKTIIQSFLYPDKDELPDDVEMSIWDHLEELRSRWVTGFILSVLRQQLVLRYILGT